MNLSLPQIFFQLLLPTFCPLSKHNYLRKQCLQKLKMEQICLVLQALQIYRFLNWKNVSIVIVLWIPLKRFLWCLNWNQVSVIIILWIPLIKNPLVFDLEPGIHPHRRVNTAEKIPLVFDLDSGIPNHRSLDTAGKKTHRLIKYYNLF